MVFKRYNLEDIDIKRVVNLFLCLYLKKLVRQIKKSNKRFAYFIFDFDRDILTEYKLLYDVNNLAKRAIKYANRSKDDVQNIIDLDVENNFIILAIIIINTQCRTIAISMNFDDLESKPFGEIEYGRYIPSSLFTKNLLVQNFDNSKEETQRILSTTLKDHKNEILTIRQHYNGEQVVKFIYNTIDEIEWTLSSHFVHPFLIKKIIKQLKENNKVVLYYVVHYLAIYPLIFQYTIHKKEYTFIAL